MPVQMLTFLPLSEIDALATAMQQPGYVPNTAQVQIGLDGDNDRTRRMLLAES